jgi:hypothetical protein
MHAEPEEETEKEFNAASVDQLATREDGAVEPGT